MLQTKCEKAILTLKYLKSARKRLEQFQLDWSCGAVIHARSKKYLLGEQPTPRTSAEEKRYVLCGEIVETKNNCAINTDPTNMRWAFLMHYSRIYESQVSRRKVPYVLEQLWHNLIASAKGLRNPFPVNHHAGGRNTIDDMPNSRTPCPNAIGAELDKKYNCLVSCCC